MKLIHKTTHKIIAYTTSVSCKEYYKISDELVFEIENLKYVVDGKKPVDLKLIDEIITSNDDSLFDTAESITYKDRELAITAYNEAQEQKANNAYFRGYKYLITVEDFSRYNKTEYRIFTDYTDKHPNIETETYMEDGVLKAKIYLNSIIGEDNTGLVGSDWFIVQNAVYGGTEEKIFKLEINPLF